ncbi:unnamed protein product [Staurois parvus]|uniref:Thioredoxin domain-containing protein n=1 Tax=Staurois parvus TaxID=386267 RepID=A0ABN9EJM1_9NEOB|nr:unnamed protein product [Staurois parvus]
MEKIRDQQRIKQVVTDAGHKVVVLMFMNIKCPHCRRAIPGMDKLALETNIAIILRCDVGENPSFAKEYDIQAVPEYFFIKSGTLRDRITGADKKTVESRIQQLSV